MTGETEEIRVVLAELLEAARGMAEGDFHRLVKVHAQGEIAELARYINMTLQNLQELDPAIRQSSMTMPKMTSELVDVVAATELAAHRVLDEAERLTEEQETIVEALGRVRAAAPAHPLLDQIDDALHSAQRRVLAIISAMEFQDLASQRIAQVVRAVREIEERLLRLLVLFKLEEAGPGASGETLPAVLLERLTDRLTASQGRQEFVDSLLAEFSRESG
jgi:chemotaxis regulatin CheY-phosphate phosphatase CheZ